MLFNLKNFISFLIIIMGFLIFFINISKLSLNEKSFIVSKKINKDKAITSNIKNLEKIKPEVNVLLKNTNKNELFKQEKIL